MSSESRPGGSILMAAFLFGLMALGAAVSALAPFCEAPAAAPASGSTPGGD